MENEKGKRRTVWLSNELDAKVEDVRKKLGLGRSGFYRYAIVEIIKQFAVAPVFEKNGEEPDGQQV
jgi:ACT domain-containing protein